MVITNPNQVSTEWLGHVHSNSGALTHGEVVDFEMEVHQRELSTNAGVKLYYFKDSQGAKPENVFLKMVKIDMEDEFFGPSEANYYARDYGGLSGAPILRCYDAKYSENQ